MKETEFKINKKKRNIIIAVIVAILIIAGIITGIVIFNKPVETEEPTTETIVVDEPTEEPASTEEPTTSEEPEETEEPTEEVKPTEEPASTEEPSHTHTWSKATCTSPKTCSCGETSGSPLGHSFSNGKCSRCGAKDPNYQEPTPPAHTHSYNSKVTTEATCTSNGTITYTCSCGDSYTESTPALGHNWSNADCTHCKTCSRCGATEGSALGHDYQDHGETVHHPAEWKDSLKCHDCGATYDTASEMVAHQSAEGHCGYGSCSVKVKDAWDEVIHKWICSRCGHCK